MFPDSAPLPGGSSSNQELLVYRCYVCGVLSKAGQRRKVHVVYKEDGNIARELPVCLHHKDQLDAGANLGDLIDAYEPIIHGPKSAVIAAAVDEREVPVETRPASKPLPPVPPKLKMPKHPNPLFQWN